jgi:hypothetical protein
VRTVAGAPVVVSYESGIRTTDAKDHVDFPVPSGEVGIDVLSQRYKARVQLQVEPGATVTRQITLTEPSGLPR